MIAITTLNDCVSAAVCMCLPINRNRNFSPTPLRQHNLWTNKIHRTHHTRGCSVARRKESFAFLHFYAQIFAVIQFNVCSGFQTQSSRFDYGSGFSSKICALCAEKVSECRGIFFHSRNTCSPYSRHEDVLGCTDEDGIRLHLSVVVCVRYILDVCPDNCDTCMASVGRREPRQATLASPSSRNVCPTFPLICARICILCLKCGKSW